MVSLLSRRIGPDGRRLCGGKALGGQGQRCGGQVDATADGQLGDGPRAVGRPPARSVFVIASRTGAAAHRRTGVDGGEECDRAMASSRAARVDGQHHAVSASRRRGAACRHRMNASRRRCFGPEEHVRDRHAGASAPACRRTRRRASGAAGVRHLLRPQDRAAPAPEIDTLRKSPRLAPSSAGRQARRARPSAAGRSRPARGLRPPPR